MTPAERNRRITSDDDGIGAALEEAARAAAAGEVPVGAVVVLDGQIIGRGANCPISSHDPTAHAEIVALRDAALARHNYRLTDTTLYVTVEPCLMCVGALIHARVQRLVFGTPEPKAGAVQSTQRAHEAPWLNHRMLVQGGVREDECRALIQEFFRRRRRTPEAPPEA
jgi:tRNA(Arg) A34 adenosine deaminase TadA